MTCLMCKPFWDIHACHILSPVPSSESILGNYTLYELSNAAAVWLDCESCMGKSDLLIVDLNSEITQKSIVSGVLDC